MAVDVCFVELLADRRNHLRRPPVGVSLSDIRAAASAFLRPAPGPVVSSVEAMTIRRPNGTRLAMRVYRPSVGKALPTVVFCHGGGFVFGDLDTHDAICRAMAVRSGCIIIAVDYRLSPEEPFPAAIEDCVAVIDWLMRAPAAFGASPGAPAIAGDSAGANIAIGSALTLRDRDCRLRHVALLYPVIDPACGSPSMREFGSGYMLTREAMQWFWECYLTASSGQLDARAAPMRADVRGFPPATIVTAEYDPLRDEGEAFAEHLRKGGGRVQLQRYSGMIHGFAGMPQLTPVALQAIDVIAQAVGGSGHL